MPKGKRKRSQGERRLAAILAADIAGYSALMGADEERTVRDLKGHQAVILPMILKAGGRVIDTAGDGILAEFSSVLSAIKCALAIQETMAERNGAIDATRRMQFRIGINQGDIVFDESRIYGDGVNIAARLESIAEAGGICISAKVHDEIRGKVALTYSDIGLQQLKNIADPVRVYRVELLHDAGAGPQISWHQENRILALPDRPSIAVLPLTNLTRDPEHEYFSDGITEDIITDLSRFSELFVIARNSSFQYKGKAVDVRQVGRELGVRYLLEGSIRRQGERVRINTQLIDCATGGHIWAERFDRNLTDIFEVQDEVTHNVVGALAIKLTADARRPRTYEGTNNLEAYDFFLRGREQRLQFTMQSIAQAQVVLKRAIELDPSFGPAYAYLADCHLVCFMNGWGENADQLLEQGYELAARAVALEPTYPRAHVYLGNAYLWKRQHDEALTAIRKSVVLAPNLAVGHIWLGWVLHYAGRSEEAIASINLGLRLDPLDPSASLHWLAQAYFQLRRYKEAVELLKRRLIRTPDSDISRVLLASAYGHLGHMSEARAEWCEALKVNPNYSLEHRRRVAPYKNPADFEHVVEGLRRAGLPQ